jgi:hypothetical protein
MWEKHIAYVQLSGLKLVDGDLTDYQAVNEKWLLRKWFVTCDVNFSYLEHLSSKIFSGDIEELDSKLQEIFCRKKFLPHGREQFLLR